MLRSTTMLLATLAVAAAPIAAHAAERRFANTGFSTVVLETSDNLTITKGGFAITATGAQADLDRLELRQDGATLRIGHKKGSSWRWNGKPLAVAVSLPSLTGVTVSGSGDATADQAEGDSMALRVSGSGDLAVQNVKGTALAVGLSGSGGVAVGNIAANTVAVSISGSGDVAVAGRCTTLDARLSGSGDLAANRLTCTNATVSTSGSGDVSVHASGQVTARTSGSGDVAVTGGARCTSRSSGSGVIRCN